MKESTDRYLYTFASHEDEASLSALEQRTWFGKEASEGWLESVLKIDPSRSPFMKHRITVRYEAEDIDMMAERVRSIDLLPETFKVIFVPTDNDGIAYEERRRLERVVGANIRGKAEMRRPQHRFGLAKVGGRFVFGELAEHEAVWLKHKDKPQGYSTALSTRVARAIVNIAVPNTAGVRALDPCCGIGTVLIEALSMGIDMVGVDINPLAVLGARKNLSHYGYPDVVKLLDMTHLEGRYDAVVLDLPYNLCSRLPEDEQLAMLRSARRLADRAVVISIEPIETALAQAGFTITDQCEIRKSAFTRCAWVCS